jgi:hypothetical protein
MANSTPLVLHRSPLWTTFLGRFDADKKEESSGKGLEGMPARPASLLVDYKSIALRIPSYDGNSIQASQV